MTSRYAPDRHHRRSIRLKGYDYTRAGAYFVTIVTQGRACWFGEVVNGQMQRSDAGRLVADAWEWLGAQYPYVELDEYVVMPNHLHGIIVIADDPRRGDSRIAPTPPGTTPARQRKPLGRLIGAFKTVSTKQVNLACGVSGGRLWQRNYYERIVRDEDELERIREYVVNNPLQWELDEENPARANAP